MLTSAFFPDLSEQHLVVVVIILLPPNGAVGEGKLASVVHGVASLDLLIHQCFIAILKIFSL